MGLSLRELKDTLISKGGYTITPAYTQLADLKSLVDNMMAVRSGAAPGSGSGSYSGITCTGHQNVGNYSLSLGDINALNIKGCSCDSVTNTTGYCTSRTGGNSCSCDDRTGSCDCVSRTSNPICTCNLNATCTCQNRTGHDVCGCDYDTCQCQMRTKNGEEDCQCYSRTESCICEDVYAPICTCNLNATCTCQNRTAESVCSCNVRASGSGFCDCESRTASGACQCNGRCACNTEKRFV